MSTRKKASRYPDEPLPRRVDGPGMVEAWLEAKTAALKQTGETRCYLLYTVEEVKMVAAGLIVEDAQKQARSMLAWYDEL